MEQVIGLLARALNHQDIAAIMYATMERLLHPAQEIVVAVQHSPCAVKDLSMLRDANAAAHHTTQGHVVAAHGNRAEVVAAEDHPATLITSVTVGKLHLCAL